MKEKWFVESLYEASKDQIGHKQKILIEEEIVNTKTTFQDLKIVKSPLLGKVLILDGVIQTTEADEFFYHEMFTHFPLISHGNVQEVLIIGAGDGGILREILKHENVKQATMIEIDGEVIHYCKKYMPLLNNGAFDNSRATVMIGDGIDFIKQTDKKFDLIIVDSTDPISVGEVLFTDEFYKSTKRCLNKNGILTTQSGVPFFQAEELKNINNRLKRVFNFVGFYIVPVPTYVGGYMCLSFASDKSDYLDQKENIIQERINKSQIKDFKYYNAKVHMASKALPEYIKNIIK